MGLIQDQIDGLKTVIEAANIADLVRIATRYEPDDEPNRVAIFFRGVDSNGHVILGVQVISPTYFDIPDMYEAVWNAISIDPNYTPRADEATMAYNELPIGSEYKNDFIEFNVITTQIVTSQGIK